ncbi:unnamed protein product [Alopecurus aequalis]
MVLLDCLFFLRWVIIVCVYSRMFVLYSSYLHMLDVVASRCGITFHSCVSEVADDGDVLGGVELEVPVANHASLVQRRFFWACASAGWPCPHDQAALQALLFLQEFYGFVICDFNYQGMLAYRELARSAVVFAASVVRTASFSPVCSTGSIIDVNAAAHWQVLHSQMVSFACRI